MTLEMADPTATEPRIELDVFVPSAAADMGSRGGSAAPQGSKSYRGHIRSRRTGRMVPNLQESSRALKPWRERVAEIAWLHWRSRPLLTGAVGVRTDFVMPRPIGTPKSRTPLAVKQPDGDKLTRAIWDALTKVIFRDDSQVIEWAGSKRIAEIGERPGCRIQVWCIDQGGSNA